MLKDYSLSRKSAKKAIKESDTNWAFAKHAHKNWEDDDEANEWGRMGARYDAAASYLSARGKRGTKDYKKAKQKYRDMYSGSGKFDSTAYKDSDAIYYD